MQKANIPIASTLIKSYLVLSMWFLSHQNSDHEFITISPQQNARFSNTNTIIERVRDSLN